MASSYSSLFRRRWAVIAILVGVALSGYFGWRHFFAEGAAAVANSDQRPVAIPVTIALAQKADFPVYLNGLGTVEPYNTVTVRSRVDGEVTKVDFKQGQMVKQGDLLVADRSASVSGSPRSGAREEGAGRGEPEERAAQPAALSALSPRRNSPRASSSTPSRRPSISSRRRSRATRRRSTTPRRSSSYATIRSPLSGKTGFRLVDPGNIVHAADTTGIVTIVKLQPISVVFTAPEEDVPQINKALAAGAVPVTALSSDGSKTLAQGQLALVNNAVDQASGTIRMKATFENTDNVLWPGLSVSTRLLVDTLKQVTVIPEDAVQRGPNGLYAFVIGDDNKAEMQAIKVGQEGNGQSVVLQGLSPGQKVVVAGQYRLQQDALVQASEASSSITPENAARNAPVKAP